MIRTVTCCAHCGTIDAEGLVVDLERREVRWAGRVAVGTPAAVLALGVIVKRRGHLVHTAALEAELWGHRADGGPEGAYSVLKVTVHRARALLRGVAAPYEIRAVYGDGYRLVATAPVPTVAEVAHV